MPNAETSTAQLSAGQSIHDAKITLATSRTYLEQGQVNRAVQILDELSYELTSPSNTNIQFAAMNTRGEACVKQGKLHLAAATYQSLLDWVDAQPREAELFRFYDRLCALYYEWNHLEKADQYLQWYLKTMAQSDLPPLWAVDGYVRLAWVRWAQGNATAAEAAMHQASLTAHDAADCHAIRRVAAAQAKLWLRQRKLALAQRWANECGLSLDDRINYQRQFEYLTLARILIARGHAAQTLPLLQQLRRAATADGRGGDLVEILVVKAVALWAQGDAQRAWTELAQALCRAEREEYVRTFVDEGAPMVDLLQHTAAKGITLIYIKNLLATFAASPLPHDEPLHNAALVEPLTRRECEVLHLVATGDANDAIANLLSISPTTVKKHLSNIFGKLGAKNRTEAVAKARSLDLL